jgi:hypothetical protein
MAEYFSINTRATFQCVGEAFDDEDAAAFAEDKAFAILDSYPDSEVRESLRQFVHYTTSRKK